MGLDLLGLTDNEQKAFRALVKHGKSSASTISRESKVSYGKIYEVLASLERKGLLQVIPEKTKMFIPSSPEILENVLEEKQKEFDKMKKEIHELKQQYIKPELPVTLAEGKGNFYKLMRESPKPKTFQYSIKYTSEVNPRFVQSHKEYLKKGITVKVLTRKDVETEKNIKKWFNIHQNIKEIDNEGVAISMVDKEIVIGLINSNTTLAIRDKAFINLMKNLFETKYKHSKVIK